MTAQAERRMTGDELWEAFGRVGQSCMIYGARAAARKWEAVVGRSDTHHGTGPTPEHAIAAALGAVYVPDLPTPTQPDPPPCKKLLDNPPARVYTKGTVEETGSDTR